MLQKYNKFHISPGAGKVWVWEKLNEKGRLSYEKIHKKNVMSPAHAEPRVYASASGRIGSIRQPG